MDLCGIAEGGATANTFSILWEKLLKNELSLKRIIQILMHKILYRQILLVLFQRLKKLQNTLKILREKNKN